jgi:hypothetical protein
VEGIVVQGILQGRREVGYWVLHCIVYIYFIPHPHLLQLGGAGKCVQEFDYRKYLIPRRRVLIGRSSSSSSSSADGLNVQLILNGSSIGRVGTA